MSEKSTLWVEDVQGVVRQANEPGGVGKQEASLQAAVDCILAVVLLAAS